MGFGSKCYFGFSVAFANSFSEQLERHGGELQRRHRQARYDLDTGLEELHKAVDAALAADEFGPAVERGLALLGSCNEHLTAAAEALVRSRADLFERDERDPTDPLIDRERYFGALDYAAIHRELAAHGAALPQQGVWQELVDRLRDGGGRAGLRLLDRQHRELQSDLRALIAEVGAACRLSGRAFAEALHGNTRAVAAVEIGFTRVGVTIVYLSLLCERAWQLRERSVATAVTAAG